MQLQRSVNRPGVQSRQPRLKVVALSTTSSVKPAKILKNAEAWIDAQGCLSREGCTVDNVADRLKPLAAPRIVQDSYIFKGHKPNNQTVEGLVKAIESAHQAYDHLVYAPVFSAANADGTAVHMAIQWCLRHKKTSMFSRGIAIEQLTFDGEGRVTGTKSCRTLLREERRSLLRDITTTDSPRIDASLLTLGALVNPDDVEVQRAARSAVLERSNVKSHSVFDSFSRGVSEALNNVLPFMPSFGGQDTAAAATQAEQQAKKWFESWATPTGAQLLEAVFSEDVKGYDGIGLSPIKTVGCEGPVLSYGSRYEAADALKALHSKWDISKGKVTDVAVAADPQIVFCSWEATLRAKAEGLGVAVGKDTPVDGAALLLLDTKGKVKTVVQFACLEVSMWSTIKTDKPRVEGAAPVSSETESVLVRQAAVPGA